MPSPKKGEVPKHLNGKNLKKGSKRTKEIASKGGKASGKAKREKKLMREMLEELLDIPLKKADSERIRKAFNIPKNVEVNNKHTMLLSLVKQGHKGNIAAIREILDRVDGRVDQNQSHEVSGTLDVRWATTMEEAEKAMEVDDGKKK